MPNDAGLNMGDWKKITVWIITVSFPVLVTAVGFTVGKIFAHETRITVVEKVQEKRTDELKEMKQEIKESKELLFKILEELRRK